MNKNELISSIAAGAGLTKEQAGAALEATLDSITTAMKSGDEVRLLGFGNFAVNDRKATTGRNPRTGETIQIAAVKVPKFKPGKGLKDAVNS
ncbi:MAG: HU family DNA-binding protein [Pseudomonadota bacterium]